MGLTYRQLMEAQQRVHDELPYGNDQDRGARPELTETHWIQITSTTQIGGYYPAKRYDIDADQQTFADPNEACWVWAPNGEKLETGVYYQMRLTGLRSVDDKAVYSPNLQAPFSGAKLSSLCPLTWGQTGDPHTGLATWSLREYDTDGYYQTVAGKDCFVVPTAGVYRFTANMVFTFAGTSSYRLGLAQGVNFVPFSAVLAQQSAYVNNDVVALSVTADALLQAGDNVGVTLYHDPPDFLSFEIGICNFSVQRLAQGVPAGAYIIRTCATTSTTTTSTTTTTTTTTGVCGTCTWACDGTHWYVYASACTGACGCITPPNGNSNCFQQLPTTVFCETSTTTTTTTTTGACGGCTWVCQAGQWQVILNACTGNCGCVTTPTGSTTCTNQPPASTWCSATTTTTTTTTTSTTTTTTTGSCGSCAWICRENAWFATSFCTGACVCVSPPTVPCTNGQTQPGQCATTTTTTTGCGTCHYTCVGTTWVQDANNCTGACTCQAPVGKCTQPSTTTTNCL